MYKLIAFMLVCLICAFTLCLKFETSLNQEVKYDLGKNKNRLGGLGPYSPFPTEAHLQLLSLYTFCFISFLYSFGRILHQRDLSNDVNMQANQGACIGILGSLARGPPGGSSPSQCHWLVTDSVSGGGLGACDSAGPP